MSNYHCSLSAINAPTGKGRRRMFIPPPRLEVQPPFPTMKELCDAHGFFPGEWTITRGLIGHIQGLQTVGVLCARHKTRALFLGNDGKMRLIHKDNFVVHYELPEKQEE